LRALADGPLRRFLSVWEVVLRGFGGLRLADWP
jgi:hypothetical protein